MIFNKGFLVILIRVLLIVLLSLGMIYSYLETDLVYTPYMFGGIMLFVVFELTWKLQSQERNWAQFLQSMRYGDFNRAYQKKTNSKALQEAYELITQGMEDLQTSRAAEIKLLQTVLRHISVAVICFRENGEIMFSNKAFKQLLDAQSIINIDVLKHSYPLIYKAMTSEEDISSAWTDHQNEQKLLVSTEVFKLKGDAYRLTSLTDIRNSLEVKELESYQKLMRVMTHEIMNSATPILSLTQIVNKKLIDGEQLTLLSEKDQQKVVKSLLAIEERTEGILGFVNAYKQINKTIEPQVTLVSSTDLIESITVLVKPNEDVLFEINDSLKSEIPIDKSLITQVLINLLNNAFDAVRENPNGRIALDVEDHQEHIRISVTDNGPGVVGQLEQEIFVPFFTTKKKGSGIGLALSRKIVLAHKGTLNYQRKDDKTEFVISLPA